MEQDKEFKFLLEKIKRNRNIDFSQYRAQTLSNRIQNRLYATDCATYWDYILLLNKDPQEYDRLIGALTIKESYFFRNSDVFESLEDKVIPEIVSQKKREGVKKIRAWSCGAAFGQEAYTMAILFCEVLGSDIKDLAVNIMATDIDKEALERAPWGSYDKHTLGKIKPHHLFKFFTQVQERYVVSDAARALVTFKRHDIAGEGPFRGIDLVLCRNLLIYFEKELQEKALNNLHAALNRGGFLILPVADQGAFSMRPYYQSLFRYSRLWRPE